MRKDNVWKQAIALILSAALVVGNGASVSAAAGDTAAGDTGATTEGNGDTTIVSPDAYKAVTFDFEDGEVQVSGDDATYTENGITFINDRVTIEDAPVVEGDDTPRGKALKFSESREMTTVDNKVVTTGDSALTTVEGAFSKYDFSNGFTLSLDVYPDAQRDWNYIFGFGAFGKKWVCGTIGFISAFGEPWTNRFPGDGWLEGNEVNNDWNYFGNEANAHKWYRLDYVYTNEGLTIKVNDVPTVAFAVDEDEMKSIMQEANKGQLRIGKGTVLTNEGFLGYIDNVTIQPVHPGAHQYVDVEGSTEPAGCTASGSKKVKCSMCGVIATVAIPATGHTYVHHEAKQATCAEAGNIEHYTCSNTSRTEYFVSGDDGVKPTTLRNVTIAQKEHDYTETVNKKATAAADGQITKTCKNCAEGVDGHSVTVAIAKASNISLGKPSYVYTGKAIEPKVTVKDSEGKDIDASNYTVTYANNTKVGTGTATITFTGDKYEGSVPKTFKIEEAASLTLNKSTAILYTGKASNTITVKVTKVTGASQAVSWTSSNTKVATVKNGKITAVGKGTANITATANGISQIVKVTVKNPTITVKNGKKAVKKNTVTVKQKKSVKLTVSTNPKNAGTSVKKLSKKDAKTASVTFKKGKLTIKGKKKGTIKVKITSGKTTKTLTVKVK